jgi:hypothetical protein
MMGKYLAIDKTGGVILVVSVVGNLGYLNKKA